MKSPALRMAVVSAALLILLLLLYMFDHAAPSRLLALSAWNDNTQLYADRGTIYLHNGSGADRALTEGDSPCFAGRPWRFLYSDAQGALCLFDLRHLSSKVLSSPPYGSEDSQVSYDPDENLAVFARLAYPPGSGARLHSWDLYTCDLQGGHLTRLTRQGFFGLRILPCACSGKKVVFVGDLPTSEEPSFGDKPRLYVYDLVSRTSLEAIPYADLFQAIFIDGEHLVVDTGSNAIEAELGAFDLKSRRTTSLAKLPGIIAPVFVPKSKKILYLRETGKQAFCEDLGSRGPRILYELR